jgi:DNA-binding transcriptional LysR family regulator
MHAGADQTCKNAEVDPLSWDDLRILLAVERGGSLAAAAAALRVDQTTVGRRLAALETGARARLVERTARGTHLTDAGRRASAIALRMEDTALAFERDVGGADARLEGDVRVHAPDSFAPTLAHAFADMHARHPRIQVHLSCGMDAPNLVRHDVDLAVRMMVEPRATLLVRKLGAAPWGVFASESYLARRGPPPESGAEWRAHDVVGYLDPVARSPGAKWLAERAHQGGARVVFRASTVVAAVAGAGQGLGVVAAPAFVAAADARLRPVMSRTIATATFSLVGARDLADVPRVRATIDHLVHWFKQRWQ